MPRLATSARTYATADITGTRTWANALDGSLPYSANTGTEDSPGVAIESDTTSLSRSDSFDMWLEFKPGDAQAQSHWVPLRRVHWEWGGTAVKSNGNWLLQSQHNTANPSDVEEQEYPRWNNKVSDDQ